MQYMVIENIKPDSLELVYERFQTKGRMLPDGLNYINSWLEEGGGRCFQLMETENKQLFEQWIDQWSDLVSFEVIPIGEKPQ